jgi:glutaminyl-peptide cyclotransferase
MLRRFFVFYILVILFVGSCNNRRNSIQLENFDASRALESIKTQLSFGPRYPGSTGHEKEINWLKEQLTNYGWIVEEQTFGHQNILLTNVVAKKEPNENIIIIGTHFDTRFFADNDPLKENQTNPVPGANDGASGVAVLLELARVLKNDINHSYWLVFFDGEDQGNIHGWDWILGSSFFAKSLSIIPKSVIIVDMIGDKDLTIYQEGFSDRIFQNKIWQTALDLNYGKYFLPDVRYSIIDDHKPFIDLGIPSALIIDIDYPFWHTMADTFDKISSSSLEKVRSTILNWIRMQK